MYSSHRKRLLFERLGATPTRCTVHSAISAIEIPRRAPSRSIVQSGLASPAADLAESLASTTGSSFLITPRRCEVARFALGRPSPTENVSRTWNVWLASEASLSIRHGAISKKAIGNGSSRAKVNGKRTSGTASVVSLPGSKPKPTKCTSAFCCRSIGRIRPAAAASAQDWLRNPCFGASAITSWLARRCEAPCHSNQKKRLGVTKPCSNCQGSVSTTSCCCQLIEHAYFLIALSCQAHSMKQRRCC